MKLFSVLIVNYKSWNTLEECLNSLLQFSSKKFFLEIIVVDNCSNDNMFEVFKNLFPSVNFLLNSGNNGFANGCNLAAQKATSNYYLFLNPDTKVDTINLETFFDYYIKDNHALLSCLQINEHGNYYNQYNFLPKFITFFGLHRAIYRFIYSKKINKKLNEDENYFYPEWVTGAVILINKKWFDSIEGWNEDYWMYMEDVDFSNKVLKKNGTVAVLKKAVLYHKHGGASRINIKTKAITKTEVIISKHTYIQNNFSKITAILLHLRLILGVLLEKSILAILSIPLFFNQKLKVNRLVLKKYISYLWNVLLKNTFISPRAMNYKKIKV